MNAQEWMKEFWQIGNWIVGFEVAQTFALFFAVTKAETRKLFESPRLKRYVVVGMLVLSIAFCTATFWTSAVAIQMHRALAAADGVSPWPHERTLWVLVAGRIGCILLLTVFCIVALSADAFACGPSSANRALQQSKTDSGVPANQP